MGDDIIVCDKCDDVGHTEATCPHCNGSGEGHQDKSKCSNCRGDGVVYIECHCGEDR